MIKIVRFQNREQSGYKHNKLLIISNFNLKNSSFLKNQVNLQHISSVMKQILLSFLATFLLMSCKKFDAMPTQVVYSDSIQANPLEDRASINIDSLRLANLPKDLQHFYQANDFKIGWSNKENRTQLLQALNESYLDGIKVKNQEIDKLSSLNDGYAELSDSLKIEADFLYTKAYTNAIQKLFNGVLNPRRLYNDWDIDKKEINTPTTMLVALQNQEVYTSFDSVRSPSSMYNSLRGKLINFYNLQKDTLKVTATSNSKVNDTVIGLNNIKKHLVFLDYYPDSLGLNDINNKEIIASIKKFQKNNKLPETGIINKKTIDAISNEEESIKQLLVNNLERWRWFPRDLGENYILINIADFSLVAVTHGDTIKKHKVIVGTTARKTPILSSVLKTVVINPTWTVPPTILKNDLVPKAASNTSYFSSRNFTIYDKKTGKSVDPANWDSSKASSYRYVQKGGVGNTLGRVKFMFDNNHAVYLHDTPNKAYFNRDSRNLSSGCVRVQDPFDLAQFIFNVQENEISKDEIDNILKSEKTKNISTNKTGIAIHQLYWTIQIDNQGRITKFKDVYGFDKDLYQKIN